MRLISIIIAMCIAACDNASPLPLQTQDRGIPMVDSAPGQDSSVSRDMLVDGAMPDGDIIDAMPLLDVSAIDANQPDQTVDMGTPENHCVRVNETNEGFPTPSHDQTTIAFGGQTNYLVWADGQGVHQCRLDNNARFDAPRELIEAQSEIEWVTSLRAGGTTWIAYGAPDLPIRVYQAHRPAASLMTLTTDELTLVGHPHLAEADGQVVVVGVTPESAVAWQVLSTDLGVLGPAFSDTSGLPIPDSVATTTGGILLRFGQTGQCVFVNASTWLAQGNLPCRTDEGGLLSSGQQALLWHLEQLGAEQFMTLRSLYDEDGVLRIGKFDVPELVAHQVYRGYKPLIGRRAVTSPMERQGNIQLYLAGTSELFESMVTWDGGWPWADARAVALAELPERITEGLCPDQETTCLQDADCGDNLICSGAANSQHALIVRFDQNPTPTIEYVPMIERALRSTATIFNVDLSCLPRPESCDRRDQDCDGLIDDGICCGTADDTRVLRKQFVARGPVEEFLIGDNEWRDAYLVAYRYLDNAGQSRWSAVRARYVYDNPISPNRKAIDMDIEEIGDCNQAGARCLNFPNDGSTPFTRLAGEGRYFNGVGGARVFIARQSEGNDAGRWGVHWIHRNRALSGSDAQPDILPAECDDILAVEALRLQDGESVVIVCRDRILRYFATDERENQSWLFSSAALGRIQPISWATVRRRLVTDRHDTAFDVLVGFRSSLGNLRLRLYDFVAGANGPPVSVETPDLLNFAEEDDLNEPVYLSAQLGGPPIRVPIDKPQALFGETDEEGQRILVWRDILTSRLLDGTSYSGLSYQLFTSAPLADPDTGTTQRGYWAVATAGDRGQYNLWATDTVHVEDGDVVAWTSMKSDYLRPLVQIVKVNEDSNVYEVGAIELECRGF